LYGLTGPQYCSLIFSSSYAGLLACNRCFLVNQFNVTTSSSINSVFSLPLSCSTYTILGTDSFGVKEKIIFPLRRGKPVLSIFLQRSHILRWSGVIPLHKSIYQQLPNCVSIFIFKFDVLYLGPCSCSYSVYNRCAQRADATVNHATFKNDCIIVVYQCLNILFIFSGHWS